MLKFREFEKFLLNLLTIYLPTKKSIIKKTEMVNAVRRYINVVLKKSSRQEETEESNSVEHRENSVASSYAQHSLLGLHMVFPAPYREELTGMRAMSSYMDMLCEFFDEGSHSHNCQRKQRSTSWAKYLIQKMP